MVGAPGELGEPGDRIWLARRGIGSGILIQEVENVACGPRVSP